MQAKLSPTVARAIAAQPTNDVEAYQSCLKAIFFSEKRTGPNLKKAIEYFHRSIARDPNYPLAWAGMADAHIFLWLYGLESPQRTVSAAKAAVRKALELDPALPEAHISLALLLNFYDYDFLRPKRNSNAPSSWGPNNASAHRQFASTNLAHVGDFERAIAEGKRALELDPRSAVITTDLGQIFMLARRYPEAAEQLEKALEMEPGFYYARWAMGGVLQLQGRPNEAMAEFQRAARLTDDPMVTAWVAQAQARAGQRDKAVDLLGHLERTARERYVSPVSLALVHLALGENAKAIDELERAYRDRTDPYLVTIKSWPIFDPLRGDPRFDQLIHDIFGEFSSVR